jgi:2-methylcitrate dehydratase PrpD
MLTEFIVGTREADWPEDTLELGRRHILDTLAAIVVCRDLETAEVARKFALAQSGGVAGGSTILGTSLRASLPDAIFASAMTGHGAEINDFNPSAFVQPGPSVVSTALTVAEREHRPGSEVVRAVIAGYELACRIPKALGVGRLAAMGVSGHGVGPVFGVAAAASSLLRFDETQIGDVLSYCGQQASGSLQWLMDVRHIEKSFVFAGMPARNGIHAALFVEAGLTGVPDVVDQAGSWIQAPMFTEGYLTRPDVHGHSAATNDYQLDYLTDDLGKRFEMPLVAYKRYPVGGPCGAVMDAMLRLAQGVATEDVDQLLIEMPGNASIWAGAEMPALNLPYLCSVILLDKKLDFDTAQDLERMHNDAQVRELMPRVEVRLDRSQEATPPAPRVESARVTLTRRDGTQEVDFVEHVRGFPANPMSHEDVEAKALELMVPKLGEKRAHTVVELVWGIDTLPDVSVLIEAIAKD